MVYPTLLRFPVRISSMLLQNVTLVSGWDCKISSVSVMGTLGINRFSCIWRMDFNIFCIFVVFSHQAMLQTVLSNDLQNAILINDDIKGIMLCMTSTAFLLEPLQLCTNIINMWTLFMTCLRLAVVKVGCLLSFITVLYLCI